MSIVGVVCRERRAATAARFRAFGVVRRRCIEISISAATLAVRISADELHVNLRGRFPFKWFKSFKTF
jgi:hypothetical protein